METNCNNTLRVAHLLPCFFLKNSTITSEGKLVLNLIKALDETKKRQHQQLSQTIISIADRTQRLEYQGIEIQLLQNTSSLSEAFSEFSDLLWKALDGFDLVHLYQFLTVFGAHSTAIAYSKKIPIIATQITHTSNELMQFGKGVELLTAILSVSNYGKSLIECYYSGKHEVLITPINTNLFSPLEKKSYSNIKTVLCFTDIAPNKGLKQLIHALPTNLHLKIVGPILDVEYFSLLKQLTKTKSVDFIEYYTEKTLIKFYKNADLYLQLSTHNDPNILTGQNILEAMSCGLPVVVFSVGAFPEWVQDPRFGKVVNSQTDLIETLNLFNNGKWPVVNGSQLVREYVKSNFSFENAGRFLLDFYMAIGKPSYGKSEAYENSAVI